MTDQPQACMPANCACHLHLGCKHPREAIAALRAAKLRLRSETEPGSCGKLRPITAKRSADIYRQTAAHAEGHARPRNHAAPRTAKHRRFVHVRSVVGERSGSLEVCAGTELETHAAQEARHFATESRFKSIRYGIAAGRRAARSDERVDLGVADVVEL